MIGNVEHFQDHKTNTLEDKLIGTLLQICYFFCPGQNLIGPKSILCMGKQFWPRNYEPGDHQNTVNNVNNDNCLINVNKEIPCIYVKIPKQREKLGSLVDLEVSAVTNHPQTTSVQLTMQPPPPPNVVHQIHDQHSNQCSNQHCNQRGYQRSKHKLSVSLTLNQKEQ